METFTTKEVQLGLFKNQDITGHPDQERMVYFNQRESKLTKLAHELLHSEISEFFWFSTYLIT